MSDKIKVLVVEPMKPCEVREISGLDEMQATVGGHIQAVYPFRDDALVLVCNEEGKNLGLPYNRPLTNDRGIPYDMICGTFFLAGLGEESFISLTDTQIEKFSKLYDNMMLLPAERPAIQAEPRPKSAWPHFAIACQLSFHFVRKEQESPVLKDAFISHVTGIFNRDKTLAERTVGDLDFSFQGSRVNVQYTFAKQDRDAASAERFSEQCVRKVQDQLEGYGCKIVEIDCFAEELEEDLSWSCAKDLSRGQETQKKKKGTHHER